MPFEIQRVPQGLLNLLSMKGGQTPRELEDRIRGTLDLTQMYGLQQRRPAIGTNGALAEAGTISAGTTSTWVVLYSANVQVTKTATMTALSISMFASGPGVTMCVAAANSAAMGPFGATETGPARLAVVMPYPMILPPGTNLFASLDILGTDATAAVTVTFDIGSVGG